MLVLILLEILEGTARITEARLNREQSEGKILAYERVKDFGYKVISYEAINCKEAKVLTNNSRTMYTLHVYCRASMSCWQEMVQYFKHSRHVLLRYLCL